MAREWDERDRSFDAGVGDGFGENGPSIWMGDAPNRR